MCRKLSLFLVLHLVGTQQAQRNVDDHEEGQLGLLGWGTNQAVGRYNFSKSLAANLVYMAANPTSIASGDRVTLRWLDAGSYNPKSNDWFGWYCGMDVSKVADSKYLGWTWVHTDPDWERNRRGLYSVMLFDFKQVQCEFRMFNHDDGTAYFKIGTSNLIHMIGDGFHETEVRLNVLPKKVKSGQIVELTWQNVNGYQSKPNDWIGFFCGNLAQVVDTAYLDYNWVRVDPSYVHGSGKEKVAINSGRQRYCEFRMFTYVDGSAYYRIGTSNVIEVVGLEKLVQHVHLALTGDTSEMLVQWTSVTPNGVVHFAPKAASLFSSAVRNANGRCLTYESSDMCHGPATNPDHFVNPGHLCEAVLTGLVPDEEYQYHISVDGGESFSSRSAFRAAPEVNPEYRFKYIVYGDMGTWGYQHGPTTTARLCAKEVETGARMTHHFGDLSYALGNSNIWDVWMPMIEPYAQLAPYMVGIGNHEFDYTSGGQNDPSGDPHFRPQWSNFGADSNGECGVPTVKRFHMPSERSGGNGLFWYSYDFGSLHTIMLSSEHNCGDGSAQKAWLAMDLAKVDRARTPWLVVELHRPMYNNEIWPGDYKVAVNFQRQFEDLLVQYDVDLVLAGHYHAYLRTKRIYKDRADEAHGIYHFTIGSAGASLDPPRLYEKDWVENFDTDFGFGRITIHNSSVMHWEYIRNRDNGPTPTVADEAWIVKRRPKRAATAIYFL